MIATLSGKLQYLYGDRAIVAVGGVGYEVFLSTDGLARIGEVGEDVFVFVHTHVREDAILLYGFLAEEEKELFLLLVTVSGVGPKLALAILSGMRVGEFCNAIINKDIKALTSLQGVGKKTAERLCMELQEKVGALGGEARRELTVQTFSGNGSASVARDVLSALVNLGYPDPVARQALSAVKRRVGEEVFSQMTLEEMLKEGLRSMA